MCAQKPRPPDTPIPTRPPIPTPASTTHPGPPPYMQQKWAGARKSLPGGLGLVAALPESYTCTCTCPLPREGLGGGCRLSPGSPQADVPLPLLSGGVTAWSLQMSLQPVIGQTGGPRSHPLALIPEDSEGLSNSGLPQGIGWELC